MSTTPGTSVGGQSGLVIRQPDDWHVHLRDGAMLAGVVNHTAKQFARAIVMPNLAPPVTTVAAAEQYRERIRAAVTPGLTFTPLMTAYLTDISEAQEIERGYREGVFTAAKLYPAKATTNSQHGVTDISKLTSVLEAMQRSGMPLLIHGEVTERHIDIFDREAVFIDRILRPLIADFPGLKVVLEHITTAEAAQFVAAAGANVAATITPHHLIINRNAMFEGGIRPHLYCLPVAKRESHRLALRKAATSGSPKFFLGTDSAPHATVDKESACGCAGIFSAPVALETYATVFAEEQALDRFEGFASVHGPRFYGLPLNPGQIRLDPTPTVVPETVEAGKGQVAVFQGGTTIGWTFRGRMGADQATT